MSKSARRKRGRQPGIGNNLRRRGSLPGPLTPRGLTSIPGHLETVETANKIDRRYKAWQYLRSGANFMEIGRQLGVSNKTACLDCWAVLDELKEATQATADRWRTLQVQQCQALILAHWTTRRQKASADVILNAMARIAKLYGLDAPAKIALTDPAGLRPYGTLSDADLEAEMQRLAQEAAPRLALPGEVVVSRANGNGHGVIGGPGGGLL